MKTNNRSKNIKITSLLVVWVAAMTLISIQTAQADTWTQKADMPTARLRPEAEVANGKIYVIGGVYANLQKVEEYDLATNTWAAKADMPTSRAMPVTDGMKGAEGGLTMGAAKDLAKGSFWSGLIDDVRIYHNEHSARSNQPSRSGKAGGVSCRQPFIIGDRFYVQRLN